MEKSCIWNFNYIENKDRLPKSCEEFCETHPIKEEEYHITSRSIIILTFPAKDTRERFVYADSNVLPDRATAEAILALCQLIQLRNCYNGDWVPYWGSGAGKKYCIDFAFGDICENTNCVSPLILYFKSEELRDEFLRYFRPLIEKLKPLYGIKEGGEE